jgi:DNA-binding transcriptional ArsR family regulator
MPIDETIANQTAELFAMLSDPSRVRIIDALLENGELNVSALAECVAMSESAVSHQLRLLRHARLVRHRKDGRQVYYSLDDEHVVELFQKGLNHILHA